MMRIASFMAVLAAAGATPYSALAQTPPSPSFAGRTIALRIGWPPGSGNNVIGRLVADHLGRHIPGQPKVISQNMPGAGSFVLANNLYAIAPRDGSVLGLISQTAATEELVGNPAAQFETAKFGWVGRVTSYNIVTTTWHTTPVKTIADALVFETTAGADSVGSTVYNYPFIMNKVLGTRFKLVMGYEGTAATALAMERREVDGISTGWFTVKTARRDWLEHNRINILVQFLAERHPDLPAVPTIVELARTPEDRQLFQMYANEGEIGKSILAPPGIPPAILAMLRKAFDDMIVDREFVAEAERQQVELTPLSGEKMQALLANAAKTPPAVVARAKALFK